ncbi:hypothetical protein [Embleya sp. NBC_00896]|uniref:hypothetical protein n=1 Tax=Embleya sp. NBC_00896 TaxID=2975961 RepID=UPI002F91788A|nr:hypothetical protein OG928_38470 [Embleya sp. NBC_00896]
MSTITTLVVPVEVSALAVNTQTRDTDGTYVFQRWQTNFRMLEEENLAPEPAPFDTELWPNPEVEQRGVYLQWQLPEALARGAHDETDGVGGFPFVPNRWLVIRYRPTGRQVRAWVVQSDHLGTAEDGEGTVEGTVSFADPHAGRLRATLIGLRHDLTAAQPWREPSNPGDPFLTAVGPGIPTFSAFQPYNENVFSIHDTLDDVEGADRLSYHVIGWYSDPTADILAPGGETLTDLLDRLEWSAPTATGTIDRSIYTGSALHIDWVPDGGVPPSKCPGPDDVAVSIGNSASEAMSGFQEQNAGASALDADEALMFRAFALGTLDALDRSDGLGEELTDQAAHQGGFGPAGGGFTWRVVEHGEPASRVALTADQRAAEQAVVADLNKAQAEHDAAERELAAAQERLYALWALSLEPKQPAAFAAAIEAELDPANSAGAAGKVRELSDQLRDLRADIPWGTTPEELARRAAEHAAENGMARSRTLSRVPVDPYQQSADPVVLLQGANLNAPLTRGTRLPCRTPDRLVSAIGSSNSASVTTDVAQVNTAGLPAGLPFPALLTEFFLLARARAAAGAGPIGTVTGALPEYGTGLWEQPWLPLFLLWEAEFTPLAYRQGDTERWHFDGTRYRWKREEDAEIPEAITVQGRQMLAPTAGHEAEGRLASYAAHRGDLPEEIIRSLREQARTEDFLSQRLDGLGAALNQRDPSVAPTPDGVLGELVGDATGLPPVPGKPPLFPWQEPEDSRFHELRAGQLAFTGLSVVDRFGRAVNLISDPLHFEPVLPVTMVPDHPIEELAEARFVELGPRLLQPARLRFDFLDAARDEEVEATPGANPVCAWLLHNRLDRSLVCFDPAGDALGELRTVMSPEGPIVHWAALPGSTVTTLAELAVVSPHTARLLTAIRQRGPAVLDAVRATLDEALAAIDPDGPEDPGLGFLLGRPLALVRARLDLELYGAARTSLGWSQVLAEEPTPPELPGYEWTIRLGEAKQTDDGLVGYVLDDDYDHFETVVEPEGESDGYLRWVDTGDRLKLAFGGDSSAIATLLVDPRVAVHAVTDILPVGSLYVPQQFTAQALARMAVSFRAGPMLASVVEGAAIMPHPATAIGSWSWAESAGDEWQSLPITAPDPTGMPVGKAELRSGFWVLDDAVEATRANGDGA